ncbi:putative Deoxynucleoside triphosphate triphosphohydrolase SAMHD1 [Paratrimastix pyriformis]|uniref:Deoxynucleoside triphosphate triphosphohydrolase SAMHD1 n=1 Tax=Paratrimastix pyriformis TaxID=342808 RepID=A0ABQ8UY94_9EUKA|nr:putative Deoxynucleoside triphosphate triphosphohydrolase SAMHD1 [Paratrimastix pyriformis]
MDLRSAPSGISRLSRRGQRKNAMSQCLSQSFRYPTPREGKLINDPIHGHITIDPFCMSVIDTPEFQRLRDLKQLGTSYFVFPGASHNRFEHSLGVGHLAGSLCERFQRDQPELELTDQDVQRVRLAGFAHDLGHGPFSHCFDGEFLPRIFPGRKFSHEDMSCRIFEHLVDQNGIDLDREDINFIKEAITGKQSVFFLFFTFLFLSVHSRPNDLIFHILLVFDADPTLGGCRPTGPRGFLYEIVSNSRNSVDVDKPNPCMSYPCVLCTLPLMSMSRVIGGEICYPAKEAYNVYEMFHTRYSLFKQIYSHRAAKQIEYMITDALEKANPVLHIAERVDDVDEFLKLTDTIVREIENSSDPGLAESQRILSDLRHRRLYKYAYEVLLPSGSGLPKDPRELERYIAGCSEGRLTERDLIVHRMPINYAHKDRNPVDSIHFFQSRAPNESFTIKKDLVSLLIPDKFEEVVVRIDAARQSLLAYVRGARLSDSIMSPKSQHRVPGPIKRAASDPRRVFITPVAATAHAAALTTAATAADSAPSDPERSAPRRRARLADPTDDDAWCVPGSPLGPLTLPPRRVDIAPQQLDSPNPPPAIRAGTPPRVAELAGGGAAAAATCASPEIMAPRRALSTMAPTRAPTAVEQVAPFFFFSTRIGDDMFVFQPRELGEGKCVLEIFRSKEQAGKNIQKTDFVGLLPSLFECFPPEPLLEASSFPLQTYIQLLSLSHLIRTRVRGTLRELSFEDPDHLAATPTTDALAALVGPCKGLVKLSLPDCDLFRDAGIDGWCGNSPEATYAGWVDEAFCGHNQLAVLEHLPMTRGYEPAVERILGHLPGLGELHIGRWATHVSARSLAALARCCPGLQVLRADQTSFEESDFTALAPLAGSLRQFCSHEAKPPANRDAFLSSLTSVSRLRLCCCNSPAFLRPIAAHLTRLRLICSGDIEPAHLPGARLERLSLIFHNKNFSASLAALLAANQATLRCLTLVVDEASSPLLIGALQALPHLTRLRLQVIYPDADGLLSALPPDLLSRLERLIVTISGRPESHPVRITSATLRCLRLHAALGPASALTLDCPALVDLTLPHLATGRQPVAIRCPRLRVIRGLTEKHNLDNAMPMPDLEVVAGDPEEGEDPNPPWLAKILAGSPRLRELSAVRLSQPDLLAKVCASKSLVRIDLALFVTDLPNPIGLRFLRQLEHLELLTCRDEDRDEPIHLRVEAPGLKSLSLLEDPDTDPVRVHLKLRGCPSLGVLSFGEEVHLRSFDMDAAPVLRSLCLGQTNKAASLLDCLARHGTQLRHVTVGRFEVSAPGWRQLVAALSRLPRLASLDLCSDYSPFDLPLACPKLRALHLSGEEPRKMVLTCPLLEVLTGRFSLPGEPAVFAVPAPNLRRFEGEP